MCLVPANPDISGIGVRIAIYLQNILGFIPAVWAVWDWKVTDHELESAETQSTTNLVLAFAILISCIVQAFTLGLTSYHATVVLSLSWMNNTNAFIYFLLYVHYKSQGLEPQVAPQWSSWIKHIQGQTKALFSLPTISPAMTTGAQAATHNVASQTGRKNGKGGVKVLFRRIALFLGSLHLTLMAGLGIWLWSSPRSFGIADASCAVDSAQLAIVGARVPFGSTALRVVSLAVYSLFILPGFNLLVPMSAFLGLYLWHHVRWVKVQSTAVGAPASTTAAPFRARIIRMYHEVMASPVFAIFVGLVLLLVVNVVFIADIELTLRRNLGIQENDEKEWGFGQILAMLLVLLPLRDVAEMVLARRLRRQERQLEQQALLAAWKGAILRKDISELLELVKKGADPNIATEDGWIALEVVVSAEDWTAFHALANSTPLPANVMAVFHDGRTALEVLIEENNLEGVRAIMLTNVDANATLSGGQTAIELAFSYRDHRWDIIQVLVDGGADINATNGEGYTVLSSAVNVLLRNWDDVKRLVNMGADVNSEEPHGTLLESAVREGNWEVVGWLADANANLNVAFQGLYGSALQEACHQGSLDNVTLLLEKGANPNLKSGQFGSALQLACYEGSLHLVNLLLENGADPSLEGGIFGPALKVACTKGSLEIASALLEQGADPNQQGGGIYTTALHAACGQAGEDLVQILLERGADPNIRVSDPGSPTLLRATSDAAAKEAEEAKARRLARIVVLLQQHGAVDDDAEENT